MKISVITINRNDATGLEKTITSVLEQSCPHIEYIVIDGASTDNSLDIIRQHTDRIDHWISEPDSGIYNAMNKGIARATGDWLIFMNAGDTFASNDCASLFLAGNHQAGIVFGDQIRVMADGSKQHWKGPGKVDFLFFYRSGIPHQSTFTHRKVFEEIGPFREDFKIYSDWEHAERAVLKHGFPCSYIPVTLSIYDKTGVSSNPDHRHTRRAEIAESRNALFSHTIWELAEECLQLRQEIEVLKKNRIVRFAITASKSLRKKLASIRKKSKHMSVILKESL
jgi:glycosyltransferase involved in cell wall biosynthesis